MNVDPNVLTVALAKALTDSVTGEVQRDVLQKAMHAYLFTPFKPNSYSNEMTTPLAESFKKAIDAVTGEVVREVLRQPEFRSVIESKVEEAFRATMQSNTAVDKMTEKFLRMFQSW